MKVGAGRVLWHLLAIWLESFASPSESGLVRCPPGAAAVIRLAFFPSARRSRPRWRDGDYIAANMLGLGMPPRRSAPTGESPPVYAQSIPRVATRHGNLSRDQIRLDPILPLNGHRSL